MKEKTPKERTPKEKLPKDQRMAQELKPHVIDKVLSTMQGWKREGGGLHKDFSFGSGSEATRAAILFIRKASKLHHHLDVSLKGPQVGIGLPPSGERLTRSDVQLAKRLDRPVGAVKKKK